MTQAMARNFHNLTPDEKTAHFAAVEADLSLTLQTLKKVRPDADFRQSLVWLEHGEYGLCFTEILELIVAESIRSESALVEPLHRLRERIGVEDGDEMLVRNALAEVSDT